MSTSKLKTLRFERGLSQKDLAELIDSHQPTICHIERGEIPNPDMRLRIAKALKVSVRDVWPER